MRALMFIVAIGVIALIVYYLRRWRRGHLREERRAAWHAKREEEDRIWNETVNKD